MDLNKRFSNKLKEYFGEKLRKLLITNDDKVYEFKKDLIALVEISDRNRNFAKVK